MNAGNEPAFPVRKWFKDVDEFHIGLTKRELFAAMAMQSALRLGKDTPEIVKIAVYVADALLAELEKTNG